MPYRCEKCRRKWDDAGATENEFFCTRACGGRLVAAEGLIEAELPARTGEPLRIFLSYGHDDNVELVLRIKAGLEARGNDVWFDKNPQKEKGIRPCDDWREAITKGILDSNQVLSFLSKHSTRDPGVCLDEIGIALGVKGGNIRTILVEGEEEVKTPPSIGHIQWLDMHDWKEQRDAGGDAWETWFKEKLAEVVRVVESDESRRFAGEIERLNGYLNPVTSDSRIRELYAKPFVGREWMFKAVEEWRAKRGDDARLFWIMGDPGVGKSAFSANLTHYHKGEVIAVHFCEWNKPDQRDPRRVVRNIAFQLATRLSSYRRLLLTLPEIGKLDGKDAQDLFDYLLSQPLRHDIDGGQERYLIVIDALDEANENQRSPLVDMLAQNARRLPEWLGILVTSRPEREVKTPLQGLNGLHPLTLETRSEENQKDVRRYLRKELEEELVGRDSAAIVEAVLVKSEGVFLYVEYVCAQLRKGVLSLDRLDEFPDGLAGIYVQYFERQFPDIAAYKATTRHALGVIAAARESLTPEQLARIFDWDTYERRDFVDSMGSIFRVIDGKLQPFHLSLHDWLTERDRNGEPKAGYYAVSPEEGQKRLSGCGWAQYRAGVKTMDVYFLKHLPYHLMQDEHWDYLVGDAETPGVLTDLLFIQEKCEAGLVHDLMADYNAALAALPEFRKENERNRLYAEAMIRYNLALRDYAVCYAKWRDRQETGETAPEPEYPFMPPELQDKGETTIPEEHSERAARLRHFANFVSGHLKVLTDYPGDTLPLADNFAETNPVSEDAAGLITARKLPWLRRSPLSAPNACAHSKDTLEGSTACASPPTAHAPFRQVATRPCASGTCRPATACAHSQDTPVTSGACASPPTALAPFRQVTTRPCASGTCRPVCACAHSKGILYRSAACASPPAALAPFRQVSTTPCASGTCRPETA